MIVIPQKLKLIENKSFFFLLPILSLNKDCIESILNISLNSIYDVTEDSEFKRRIYVVFSNYDFIKKSVEDNELFIKEIVIDEDFSLVSFKIPSKFLLDADFISTSDYTKCSQDYKLFVLDYYKNVKLLFTKLKKYFYPSEEQIESVRKDLMLDKNIKITELGGYFNNIDETFSVSKFLNLK